MQGCNKGSFSCTEMQRSCALRPTRRSEIFLGATSLQFGSFPRMSQEKQNNSALNMWKDESRGDTGTAGGICSDTQGVEPH